MDYSNPRQGEQVRYDGRQFRFTEIEPPTSPRGWWFRATSVTGETTLQGNLRIRRRGLSEGWETV